MIVQTANFVGTPVEFDQRLLSRTALLSGLDREINVNKCQCSN